MRLLTPILALTLVGSIAASTAPWAQVYRSLDADGAVSFSDRPTPNAMELDVPLRAPATAQADPDADASSPDFPAPDPGPYDDFAIVSPADDHRSREPEGELQVSMLISPALMDGHRLLLEVDDAPVEGDLPNPAQVMLRGMTLGTHRVRAVIRDADDRQIANTATISVHLLPPPTEAAPDTESPEQGDAQ